MTKQQCIKQNALVLETLPDAKFRVKLEINGNVIVAYTSGSMRRNYIKIYPGDRVQLEMSPYDTERGRITYRYKKQL